MIKNLAIKGGGVKGIAYVGALHELENAGMLGNIERVAGTSAGALLATMMSAGYSVKEIEDIMFKINFKKFESGFNIFRIFSKYGIFSGDYILNFIHDFLDHSPKKLNPNVTFSEMRQAGCKLLYVFACNVSTHTVEEFSADKTPDVIVAEAVRASMSIPYFFKAWQFSTDNENKHIYVDGGVVFNYPLSFFDNRRFNTYQSVNLDTIGLYLYGKPERIKSRLSFSKPLHFTKKLFESLMDTQDFQVHEDREILQRSIMIDDLNIPATDFKLSKDKMHQLIKSGALSAKAYLNTLSAGKKM